MSSAHAAAGGPPGVAQTAAPAESRGEEAGRVPPAVATPRPREIGGRPGPLDPTRYGDWEREGRCIDF